MIDSRVGSEETLGEIPFKLRLGDYNKLLSKLGQI